MMTVRTVLKQGVAVMERVSA